MTRRTFYGCKHESGKAADQKSVQSTMQITKAMELVASSKLRKSKGKGGSLPALF